MDRKEYIKRNKEAVKERRKIFFKAALPSLIIIVICIVCMSTVSLAWFTATKSVSIASLEAPKYTVSVDVKDGSTTIDPKADGTYNLQCQGSYMISVTLNFAGKNNKGYCCVHCVYAGGESKQYTAELTKGTSADYALTVDGPSGNTATVSFEALWSVPATKVNLAAASQYTAETVATVNGTQNNNLLSAIEAAVKDSATLIMVKDLNMGEYLGSAKPLTGNLTIDLNGHTLTVDNESNDGIRKIHINGGHLTITDTSSGKHGKIAVTNLDSDIFEITNSGSVSLQGGWYPACVYNAHKSDAGTFWAEDIQHGVKVTGADPKVIFYRPDATYKYIVNTVAVETVPEPVPSQTASQEETAKTGESSTEEESKQEETSQSEEPASQEETSKKNEPETTSATQE